MKLILDLHDDNMVSMDIEEAEQGVDVREVIAALLSVMENFTAGFISRNKLDTKQLEDLYDLFDYMFYLFMEKVFPDTQPRAFDLSDAGLIYAQDQIIKRAEKKGISFDEALAEYEEKAKAYVRKNSGVMAS